MTGPRVGKGMQTSYAGGGSVEERQAAAKASLEELVIPEPFEDEDDVADELEVLDRDGFIEQARKLEIQLLRGLRMARSAAWQLSELSVEAAFELAVAGESNPIQSVLGVGAGSGLPEGKVLLSEIFIRTADRLMRDGDFDADSLKSP